MTFKTVVLGSLIALAFGAARAADGLPSNSVENFVLPYYTEKEGYHSMLLRGSKARLLSAQQVELDNMNLTVFSGDASNRVESVLLSPLARISTDDQIAQGPSSVRLIRDDLELTGRKWTYQHLKKRISIEKDVRVVFHTELKNLLK